MAVGGPGLSCQDALVLVAEAYNLESENVIILTQLIMENGVLEMQQNYNHAILRHAQVKHYYVLICPALFLAKSRCLFFLS